MNFIKTTHKYLRLKLGGFYLYFSHHAMQPIQFEKQQRKKKKSVAGFAVRYSTGQTIAVKYAAVNWIGKV